MPAETSWLQLHVCALYQSHVLFIEVKTRNHAISGLPSWKLSWRKRWLSCERDCHKRLWRFQKQSCLERGRKVRFSAWCKAQEAWSSGVSEWLAVQALIKYLQNLWLFLSAFNLTGTTTRLRFDETVTRVQHYYAFHEEASLKVHGIKGSTSQTQGPDWTLSATTLNSVKMILEGLTRLRTKVMELNPNFIQHLDVESLLTLFVENFFSSLRGGNTHTPMMLDFCLRFPRCINE